MMPDILGNLTTTIIVVVLTGVFVTLFLVAPLSNSNISNKKLIEPVSVSLTFLIFAVEIYYIWW